MNDTEPTRPARRRIPTLAGIVLSPLAAGQRSSARSCATVALDLRLGDAR
ncbi:MAG: hypothetical protein IPK26_02710 [Planctomycetes bacterium]|nr:hypothetical protein [Planctomycetota bacterium]